MPKTVRYSMGMSLLEAVAEFVGKPPGSIAAYMIHLPRAVEREGYIKALEAVVGPLERFDAYDGTDSIAAGHSTTCATEPGKIRTAGEIGCLVSHIEVVKRALLSGKSHVVVFEDDCVATGDFRTYLQMAKRFMDDFGLPQDLILLGACGCYTWRFLTKEIKATDNFNGTHAYIMARPMMEKLVGSYEYLRQRDAVIPIDGLLGLLLRSERRWALCPMDEKGLFVQNRDIPSYILNNGKSLRQE